MEGRINGPKGREKPKKTFIGVIIELAGCNGYSHMKAGIKDRRVNFCYD